MHCFTVTNGLLATRIQHINECRRDFPGNCETCCLFAEFFIYSKHKPTSAPWFPFLIRSNFLDSACRICRNRRHPTWQGPNARRCEQKAARNDVASDHTRRARKPTCSQRRVDVTKPLRRIGMCRNPTRPAGERHSTAVIPRPTRIRRTTLPIGALDACTSAGAASPDCRHASAMSGRESSRFREASWPTARRHICQ